MWKELDRAMRLLACGVVVLSCLLGQGARAEAPIVLKGMTPWTQDYDLSQSFFIFRDLVHEKLGDRVKIEYLGGPEVTQAANQFAALQNGVVDVLLGAAAYYRGEVPLAAAVQFTTLLPSELRKSGYFDLMRRIHADAGVVYLANTSGGNQFRMYLRKPIDKPDFSGLRLRGSPAQLPMIRALGGSPMSIGPDDVYTALERNVIDGFGWTYTGIDVYGWHEVTKYVVNHPFYSLDGAILFSKAAWEKLPEDVRQEMEKLAPELELRIEAQMKERLQNEDKRLAGMGLEFITFSDEDARYFLDTTMKAGWDEFIRQNAAAFEKDQELAEQLQRTGNRSGS